MSKESYKVDCLLTSTIIYQDLEARESRYLDNIRIASKFAGEILQLVTKVFESYTIHDIRHSINVMDCMYSLITDAKKVSDEVLVLIIYSALFHDIGMSLNDDEIKSIKTSKNSKDNELKIDFQKTLKSFDNDEGAALAGVVRSHHGERSARLLRSYAGKTINRVSVGNIFCFKYENGECATSFLEMLAQICESHEKSISWIQDHVDKELFVTNNISVHGEYIAYLLRIADLLDFDSDRAPRFYEWIRNIPIESSKYHYINQIVAPGNKVFPANIESCLKNCPNSDKCGKSQKIIRITGNYPNQVNISQLEKDELFGKCLEYFEYTEKEITEVMKAAEGWKNTKLGINLCNKIILQMNNPEKQAIYPPKKLEVEYPVIQNLFLGENLYKDKKIGLRELLQNAIDACIELRETYSDDRPDFSYVPEIKIIMNEAENSVIIQDNGIGMSFSTITDCFLHIGKSIYSGDKYKYTNFHKNHIGHFGIGFFATFMLSKEVEILTKFDDSKIETSVRMVIDREFVTIVKKMSKYPSSGTQIKLNYTQFMTVFESIDNIKDFIKKNFVDCNISFLLQTITANGIDSIPIPLYSIGSINKAENEIDEVDLSSYFNEAKVIAHLKYSGSGNSELRLLKDERNFLYNGTKFDQVDFITFEKFIISCTRPIGFYKIPFLDPEPDCNLFVPEMFWIENRPPFGYNGYSLSVNISYPDLPIYGNYLTSDFMTDAKVTIQIPHRASIQCLNVIGSPFGLVYYSQNIDFRKKAKILYINLACGEADRIDVNYIRNVLVPNFHINIPYVLEDINIININSNIFTDNIFPSTDRSDVPINIRRDFSYAVGKAVLLYVHNKTEKIELKNKIDCFIKKFYKNNNIFLKD